MLKYNIDEMYTKYISGGGGLFGGDIAEHLPTLRRYSSECEHITEMGVRSVVSTWAFLVAKPKKLISYDINPPTMFDSSINIDEIAESAKLNGTEFVFKLESTLTADIEETDLLFIDTAHIYDQLKKELELHSGKTRKYIIMHDTTTFATTGEDPTRKGLMYAIEEFLTSNAEWHTKEVYTNCNGLTILERIRG